MAKTKTTRTRKKPLPYTIKASEFKARCLGILDEVKRTRQPVVITKRGVPVAKLFPFDGERKRSIFGCGRGTVEFLGDIIRPAADPDEWESNR